MKLLVKKLRDKAKLPTKNNKADAGFDLYVCLSEDFLDKYGLEINPGETFKVETGVAIAVPKGYFAKVFDRSGIGSKGIETLAGVIDSGYRGEWLVVIHNTTDKPFVIHTGDKIAQFVVLPVPDCEICEVDSLDETERGDKGFGSSDLPSVSIELNRTPVFELGRKIGCLSNDVFIEGESNG